MHQVVYHTQTGVDLTVAVRAFRPPKGVEVFCSYTGRIYPSTFQDAEKGRRMHGYMERTVRGVRYKVSSLYEGGADFRELYERCLASRLLKLHEKGCAGDAAGD